MLCLNMWHFNDFLTLQIHYWSCDLLKYNKHHQKKQQTLQNSFNSSYIILRMLIWTKKKPFSRSFQHDASVLPFNCVVDYFLCLYLIIICFLLFVCICLPLFWPFYNVWILKTNISVVPSVLWLSCQ
jgi:hypothetical protein